MNPFSLYPLAFNPSLHEKVWGGHYIANTLKHNSGAAQDVQIGESWEIYSKNIISNGDYKGLSLSQLIGLYPLEMCGSPAASADFPLLIKFLDARQWLSVQVHPDDILANELEGQPRGKTECWFILHADADAQIIYGLKPGITVQEYKQAIAEGRHRDCLHFMPVKTGDFIYVPAGTVHAIGPGIVLYELQQTSDTTYRLYDWDRAGLDGQPRELHIEKGILCTKENQQDIYQPSTEQDEQGNIWHHLIKARYFGLDLIEMKGLYTVCKSNGAPLLLTIPADSCSIQIHIQNQHYLLQPGYSYFIPAAADICMLYPAEAGHGRILLASESKN
jgi:mannose-6-phosphate isomerase